MLNLHMSRIAPLQKVLREIPLIRLFIWGYLSSAIVGWLVLQLPFCQKSFVSTIDAFFTSASAVSTTGLTTVDIGNVFSFPGQLVILVLIQLGGIGYMIFSSFIILRLEQKMSDFSRRNTSPASILSRGLTIQSLVKQVVIYTMICEFCGLIALYGFFRNSGVENSLWSALFHSVSAFCTTGFSLFSLNLEGYQGHFGINAILSFLSLFGALGFFLWIGISRRLTGVKGHIRLAARTTKSFPAALVMMGAILFLWMTTFPEESSGFQKLIISFFQVVSTISTAGFNTIDIRTLSTITHLFLIVLMLLGVSLAGSGINMRGTSFSLLLMLMLNVLKVNKMSCLRSQRVLLKRMQIASSTFIHYFFVLLVFNLALIVIEKQATLPLLFETASALCTVGLSMGMTAKLSIAGKSLLIILMLMGRIGIVILGFAFSFKELAWEKEIREVPSF